MYILVKRLMCIYSYVLMIGTYIGFWPFQNISDKTIFSPINIRNIVLRKCFAQIISVGKDPS